MGAWIPVHQVRAAVGTSLCESYHVVSVCPPTANHRLAGPSCERRGRIGGRHPKIRTEIRQAEWTINLAFIRVLLDDVDCSYLTRKESDELATSSVLLVWFCERPLSLYRTMDVLVVKPIAAKRRHNIELSRPAVRSHMATQFTIPLPRYKPAVKGSASTTCCADH